MHFLTTSSKVFKAIWGCGIFRLLNSGSNKSAIILKQWVWDGKELKILSKSDLTLVIVIGYMKTGSISLAQTQDRLISLKRIASSLKYVWAGNATQLQCAPALLQDKWHRVSYVLWQCNGNTVWNYQPKGSVKAPPTDQHPWPCGGHVCARRCTCVVCQCESGSGNCCLTEW